MSKLLNFLFLALLALKPLPIKAEEQANIEPHIEAKFYSAYAIIIIPKLRVLNSEDAGFNKVIFKLPGFPTDKNIILETKRLAGSHPNEYVPLTNFRLEKDGSLQMHDGNHKEFLALSSKTFLPGERVTYRFHTEDGSINQEISGIPAPATFRDDCGKVVMRAELLSVTPTVYKIDFPTMPDGEEYTLKSTSMGETVKAKPKYNSKAPFHYSPAVSGKSKGGHAILEIKRENGEIYFLELPWGTALTPYLEGKKAYLSY